MSMKLLKMVLSAMAWVGISVTAQAADVGVSVSISQPGVYGQIDIGRFPQPALVVPRPVIIQPAPVPVQPMYLWVPPRHRMHWARYCGRYHACGAPVYFVQEEWYRRHVAPAPHWRGPAPRMAPPAPHPHHAGPPVYEARPEHSRGHGHEH